MSDSGVRPERPARKPRPSRGENRRATPPAHGLAPRDGVNPSCVGLPGGGWATITDFLVERFPAISRAAWIARMQAGLVADEHGVAVTEQRPYPGQLRVYYYRELEVEPAIPFEETLLYQDEHLVVADKPHFLQVTPSGPFLQQTLLLRLKNKLGLPDLVPIHRIDRETAGIVLFSTRADERDAYQALFRRHEVVKRYEAIARHDPALQFPLLRQSRIVEDEVFFRQREMPGEPNSETRIERLEVLGEQARYGLSPVSGKKHQLRVHMNGLGLPILNDRIYPPVERTPEDDWSRPLQLLAKWIAFTDPITGAPRRFESDLRLRPLSPLFDT